MMFGIIIVCVLRVFVLQRLRTENRLLKQRIDTLEKVSETKEVEEGGNRLNHGSPCHPMS